MGSLAEERSLLRLHCVATPSTPAGSARNARPSRMLQASDTDASGSPTPAAAPVRLASRTRVGANTDQPALDSQIIAACPCAPAPGIPPHSNLPKTDTRTRRKSQAQPPAAARRPLRAQVRSATCPTIRKTEPDRPAPFAPGDRSPWHAAQHHSTTGS